MLFGAICFRIQTEFNHTFATMKKEKAKKTENGSELEQKIAELTAGWQRTQADFDNFRRQSAEEKMRIIKSANSNIVSDLLPVLDNFQLAAKHVPAELADNAWAQGIKQIEKQLEDILASEGLEPVGNIGEEFDPSFHEAVEHVASDKPEDEIVEVVLRGYKMDGDLIRPAKVKVSSGAK